MTTVSFPLCRVLIEPRELFVFALLVSFSLKEHMSQRLCTTDATDKSILHLGILATPQNKEAAQKPNQTSIDSQSASPVSAW